MGEVLRRPNYYITPLLTTIGILPPSSVAAGDCAAGYLVADRKSGFPTIM